MFFPSSSYIPQWDLKVLDVLTKKESLASRQNSMRGFEQYDDPEMEKAEKMGQMALDISLSLSKKPREWVRAWYTQKIIYERGSQEILKKKLTPKQN